MLKQGVLKCRKPCPDKRWNQDGAALLTVLLVTALVTIMAVAMTSRQLLDIRRTENVMAADAAYYLAKGGESWAARVLIRDRKDNDDDNLSEEWAQGLPPVPVAGGTISGDIVDLQGRFNVNNLIAPDQKLSESSRNQFERLLAMCQLGPEVVDAVVDWMDEDDEGWAEDWAYVGLETPYRTAAQPMCSASELLLVQGMTAKGYQCLAPFICALPPGTSTNINTASAAVLASMADNLPLSQAERIVEERPEEGYKKIGDFLAKPELAGTGFMADNLTLSSNYFMVQSRATLGRGKSRLFSILYRNADKVKVLRRTMGTY